MEKGFIWDWGFRVQGKHANSLFHSFIGWDLFLLDADSGTGFNRIFPDCPLEMKVHWFLHAIL
jgi:hypothetical protein